MLLDSLLMLNLTFCFTELNICFFKLFVYTLNGCIWLSIKSFLLVYCRILWLIEFIAAFVIWMEKWKVRFAHSLWVNIFLSDLGFHYHRLGYCNCFRWSCDGAWLLTLCNHWWLDIYILLTIWPRFIVSISTLIIYLVLSISWGYVG